MWQFESKQQFGAWVTGFYNCQVQWHAGTACGGFLPPRCLVGRRKGAGKVKKRQVRDWKEKRQTVLWWLGCRGVAASIWSFFKGLSQRCGRSECVIGFACVFSFQKRGQVCSIGPACAVSLWLYVSVCLCGRVCTAPTHMSAYVHSLKRVRGEVVVRADVSNRPFVSFPQQEAFTFHCCKDQSPHPVEKEKPAALHRHYHHQHHHQSTAARRNIQHLLYTCWNVCVCKCM